MKTFSILGFGSRGQMFAKLILEDSNAKLVAVGEPVIASREKAITLYGVKEDLCFDSAESFFQAGKICDAVFICTQDKQHFCHVIEALNLGYDICLEKPAATSIVECVEIKSVAEKLNRKVMLTHVLRYTPFYQYLKKLIDGGKLGKVVTISQTENIAYWHFGLSYVRGPWAKTAESTPAIVAKCSHDLDILHWLVGDKCVKVSSFGNLFYYNEENAPKGSTSYCIDCNDEVKSQCLYNAFKVYPDRIQKAVVGGTSTMAGKNIMEVLSDREHTWGKCIYRAGNDAVDHQVVNLLFKNNVTAHLTMTAFSEDCYRFIKIHGTEGEAYGDMEEGLIHFTRFGMPKQVIDVKDIQPDKNVALDGGHGGGDYYLYKDFCDYITDESFSFTRTSIKESIESHVIGFLAEESRVCGGKVMEINNNIEKN